MRRRRPACRRQWALPFWTTATAMTWVACCWGLGDARADEQRISLRAELGAEYDSNVHRTEELPSAGGTGAVGSPLSRAVLGWSASDRLGHRQDVTFSLLGAAKLFALQDARSENVGIVESGGSWRIATSPRTRLGLSAAYYEAIQAGTQAEQQLSGEARDFRSLAPVARFQSGVGDGGLFTAGAGYRWFRYKPNHDYDFGAPVLSAEYQLTRESADGSVDWDLSAGAGVELRRFAGARLVRQMIDCDPDACALLPDPAGAVHQDQFVSGHASITRTGQVLLGLGYAVQWNRSNSYAETLVRHVGTFRFTAPLPLGFYLAARAELVYVTYADRVTLIGGRSGQAYATIDDENRSQLRAELSRDLARRLQLIARYSLYVNPLGQLHYRRQTATLSLAFTID